MDLSCSTSTTSVFNTKIKSKHKVKKKPYNFQNLKLGRTKGFGKHFRALAFHLLSNLQFCSHLRTSSFLKDKVVHAIKHPDEISDIFFSQHSAIALVSFLILKQIQCHRKAAKCITCTAPLSCCRRATLCEPEMMLLIQIC